jgi:hypothetical protein
MLFAQVDVGFGGMERPISVATFALVSDPQIIWDDFEGVEEFTIVAVDGVAVVDGVVGIVWPGAITIPDGIVVVGVIWPVLACTAEQPVSTSGMAMRR